MLIRPAIGDTDPIRYRRPTPDGQFSGNIIDEAMRMRDIRHRSEPTDAGMRGGFRILALDIGDIERHVDKPHAEFEGCLMHRIGCKCRGDAWCNATVLPGNHLAVLVEASLDTFRRDGMQ